MGEGSFSAAMDQRHCPFGEKTMSEYMRSDTATCAGRAADPGAGPCGVHDHFPAGVPERLAGIEAKLDAVAGQVKAERDRAIAQERVIDYLHGELDRLRSNDRVEQLRPVVADLRRLRAGLLRQAGTLPAGLSRAATSALLESFALDVELALERCGLTVLVVEPDEQFCAARHQVVRTEATGDVRLDGAVAGVVEDGYVQIGSGKVVAPAKVVVRRLRKRQEENTDG
jgi:molecular chaperone GrpE